jgi:hypothetical protein
MQQFFKSMSKPPRMIAARCCVSRHIVPVLASALLAAWAVSDAWGQPHPDRVALRFDVRTTDGNALHCRIHLFDEAGKPQHPAEDLPYWNDHFICDGKATVNVPPGKYTYHVERGPEYTRATGIVIARATTGADAPGNQPIQCQLDRIADMAAEGWYSGDLHIHRPVEQLAAHMAAEDLHIAPVITWWNNQNLWREAGPPTDPLRQAGRGRWYEVLAGEDERGGGALLYFHLPRPLNIAGAQREYPSSLSYLQAARQNHPQVWIDVEKPFWWDVPAWVATEQVDSIGIANNHMCRSQMYEDEAWGKPRDARRLPSPRGNGFWSQEIYYHLLNCGVRLPPSAGSASGVLPNPVGYNRVYVHLAEPLSYTAWWDNLRSGRCFVTNGPLLLCKANGRLPGHVFVSPGRAPLTIEIDVSLISLDAVPHIEIIRNGSVVEILKSTGQQRQVWKTTRTFDESGWFLLRAIADNPRTFRFASTAPFYVEIGEPARPVSRSSAQFFLQWIDERIRLLSQQLTDPRQREEVLQDFASAREFWQTKVQTATRP